MSFKETLAELRDSLRKSNRQNLAHAFLKNEEAITLLKEQIVKREELQKQIEDAGDESSWIDQNSADRVRGLFDLANKDWLK